MTSYSATGQPPTDRASQRASPCYCLLSGSRQNSRGSLREPPARCEQKSRHCPCLSPRDVLSALHQDLGWEGERRGIRRGDLQSICVACVFSSEELSQRSATQLSIWQQKCTGLCSRNSIRITSTQAGGEGGHLGSQLPLSQPCHGSASIVTSNWPFTYLDQERNSFDQIFLVPFQNTSEQL